MRVQNARSWAHKYAVGAHFRGCIWLENFASVSVYAGVVWSGARFRGCAFSRVHRSDNMLDNGGWRDDTPISNPSSSIWISDWLFGPRDGRSNRPRDKIRASASLRARHRRWSAWSNLYHFNHDSAERSNYKSKLWRFFGFGFAKKSSSAACHGCSSTWFGPGHLMVSGDFELWAWATWERLWASWRPGAMKTVVLCGDTSRITKLSQSEVSKTFLCAHTHTHTHARTSTHTYTWRMSFVFIVTHTHTHTHTQSHPHTHTHTHTHLCMYAGLVVFHQLVYFRCTWVIFRDLESWFGVPQGSILGPLFFLIYTHDLPDAVEAGVECDQFADDTALLTIHSNRDAAVANMQLGVNDTTRWLDDWRLQVNVLKTYAMEITRSTLPHPKPHILLGGSHLEVTSRQKHLGLVITATLSWKEHIASILQKAARVLGVLRRLRRSLSQAALRTIYICYIRPILEYASVTWSNLTRSEADQLERFQRRAARLILGIPLFKRVDHSLLLTAANLPTLESRRACALAVLGQQLFTGAVPNHLKGVNLPKRVATYELRRRQDTQIPTAHTSAYRDSVILKSLHTFHSLPMSLQKIKSPHHFRAAAVKHLETHICTCSSQPLPH